MQEPNDHTGKTIVVADDNRVNTEVIKAILQKSGYQTKTASNGKECIESVNEFKPDLLILDIEMPIMNGIEACRCIKQNDLTKDIPIIFVTARTDDETLIEAFEVGGADYVLKPISRIELLTRIKSVLTHKEMTKKLLKEKMFESVLQTAGGICHELNQPLQIISGAIHLLTIELEENSPLSNHAEKINTQVERIGKITNKLMKITRFETKDYIEGSQIIDLDKASSDYVD